MVTVDIIHYTVNVFTLCKSHYYVTLKTNNTTSVCVVIRWDSDHNNDKVVLDLAIPTILAKSSH